MKSRIKLNFNNLKSICDNTSKYMNALSEMKYAVDKINSRLESENSGEAVNALIDSYKDLEQDINTCYNEVYDLNSIFTGYMNEMGSIIAPLDSGVDMKIDRDDIWWNIDSVKGACISIASTPSVFHLNGFDGELTEDEKQNSLKNAHRVKEINNTYTNIIERINGYIEGTYNFGYDVIRGVFGALVDAVKGVVSLAVGLIKGLGTYTVAFCGDVYSNFNSDLPDWMMNIRGSMENINNTVNTVINDPMILVEGIAESMHNAYEEEGIVYCSAYAVDL